MYLSTKLKQPTRRQLKLSKFILYNSNISQFNDNIDVITSLAYFPLNDSYFSLIYFGEKYESFFF